MSTSKAGGSVSIVFAVAFAISFTSLFVAEYVHAISSANLNTILYQLLIAYSAPVSALVAGIFAKRQSRPGVHPLPFWTAIVVCGIWNLLLVWRCVEFGIAAFSPTAFGGLKDLLDYFETVSKAGFILTGPITYLFASTK